MNRWLRSPLLGGLGWLLALALVVARLVGSERAEAPAAVAAVETQSAIGAAQAAPAEATGPLLALQRCGERLRRVEARCAEAVAAGATSGRAAALDDARQDPPAGQGVAGAGADPQPVAAGDTRNARAGDGTPAQASSAGRQLVSRVLGVPMEEARWLEQYVCAVGDLRAGALDELREVVESGGDGEALDRALSEAQAQRRAVLDDLQQRLGEERYTKLRSVGGLGLLGSALSCERADDAPGDPGYNVPP
ncbi:MAG: hypothetical protein OEZ06_11430 [Myxococcales bacterium]|nr:hypothetical protein [Myxococcales bacterium]